MRNREKHLKHCLRSIAGNDLSDTEVVIVDYGGSDDIPVLVRDLGFEYIYSDSHGIFAKTHALNIGLRNSRGEYVANIDADMILAPNFVSELKSQAHPGSFIMCRCRCLKRPIDEGFAYEDIFKTSKTSMMSSIGACQMAHREVWERIGGQDEEIVGWGSEDWDIVHRMRLAGLQEVYIDDKTSFLHQYHADPFATPYRNKSLHRAHDEYVNKMIHDGVYIRNIGRAWGERVVPSCEAWIERVKLAHHSWRSARKKSMAGSLPKVSVIVPSKRLEKNVDLVIRNYAGQTYRNKEMVVVSDKSVPDDVVSKIVHVGGRVIFSSDQLGYAMNAGMSESSGDIMTKVDDDDIYDRNYLSDMVCHLLESGADVSGKAIGALFVEHDGVMYTKDVNNQRHFVTNYSNQVVHGSAMMFHRHVWDQVKFRDVPYGEDTLFEREAFEAGHSIYVTDPFNYIYVRRSDLSSHTWKIDILDRWRVHRTDRGRELANI